VLDVELAGYKMIFTLLENLVKAVLSPEKAYSQQLLMRIPKQYEIDQPTTYGKVMSILDYISGMTDVYALDLFRKVTGINVSTI
jgi:dGTPase